MKDLRKAQPEVRHEYLVRVLDKPESAQLYLLVALWLVASIAFSIWWLHPAHFTGPLRFAFNSFILAWGLLMPATFFISSAG